MGACKRGKMKLLLASTLLVALARAAPFADIQDTGFPDPNDAMLLDIQAPTGFKLSSTLQDHMVLQRAPASAVVWGFATPGTVVTTSFHEIKPIASTADATGVWRAKLPPTPATSTGQSIYFSASTGEKAVLKDVLFGDVFVCGGQS